MNTLRSYYYNLGLDDGYAGREPNVQGVPKRFINTYEAGYAVGEIRSRKIREAFRA